MAAFVLDASVAISWRFPGDPTEDTPYSRRVLDAAHLDLALRTGLALATSDESLRRAAIVLA